MQKEVFKPRIEMDENSPQERCIQTLEDFFELSKKYDLVFAGIRRFQTEIFSGLENYYIVLLNNILYCGRGLDEGKYFQPEEVFTKEFEEQGFLLESYSTVHMIPQYYFDKNSSKLLRIMEAHLR